MNKYIILIAVFFVKLPLIFSFMPCYDENGCVEAALRLGKSLDMFNYSHGQLYQILLFILYGANFLLLKFLGIMTSPIDMWNKYLLDSTNFILMARFLTLLFSIGVSYLTYKIGEFYYVGIKSMLIVSFLLVFSVMSILALSDMTTVFFLMLSFYLILKKKYLWSFFMIGLACATKCHVVFGIIPILIASPNKIKGIIVSILGFVVGFPSSIFYWRNIFKDTFIKLGNEYIVLSPMPLLMNHLINSLGFVLLCVVMVGVIYSALKRTKLDILILSFIVPFTSLMSCASGYSHHILSILPFLVILGMRVVKSRLIFAILMLLILLDMASFAIIMKSPDTRQSKIEDTKDMVVEGFIGNLPIHSPPFFHAIKKSYIIEDDLKTEYVMLTSNNDSWEELSYYEPEYFTKRKAMKKHLNKKYKLCKEIVSDKRMSYSFPLLMNKDYKIIREYDFGKFKRGPDINIYKKR